MSDCDKELYIINNEEMPDYGIDDFISLERVAEKVANKTDDKPDLKLTTERCVAAGVSLAIWNRIGGNVFRRKERGKPSLMRKGDYITFWRNAFFLGSECIEDLYRSRGNAIRGSEFYSHGVWDAMRERLVLATAHEYMELVYHGSKAKMLEMYGVDNIEDLPIKETKLLQSLKAGLDENFFHDDVGNDCFFEFDFTEVKVLRSDLVRLEILDARREEKKFSSLPTEGESTKYDNWQDRVNEMYSKNNSLTHSNICRRLSKELGYSSEYIRRHTDNPKNK